MFEHYGYFHTMLELSDFDYQKLEYWREQPFRYILNCRSHWKDWQQEQIDILKKK